LAIGFDLTLPHGAAMAIRARLLGYLPEKGEGAFLWETAKAQTTSENGPPSVKRRNVLPLKKSGKKKTK